MPICCTCKQEKPSEQFGKDRRRSNGCKSRCHVCQSEYDRQYRAVHRDELVVACKEYYWENHEKQKERGRTYYCENREPCLERAKRWQSEHLSCHAEKMREYRQQEPERYREIARRSYVRHRIKRNKHSRQYYLKNRDERLVYAAQYRAENAARILQWNRERKARQEGIEGVYTLAQWERLCSFFEGVCPACGKQVDLTIDHIIPVTWPEATNWIDNIQPLCLSCNCSKNDVCAVDYRSQKARLWARQERKENANSGLCNALPPSTS